VLGTCGSEGIGKCYHTPLQPLKERQKIHVV